MKAQSSQSRLRRRATLGRGVALGTLCLSLSACAASLGESDGDGDGDTSEDDAADSDAEELTACVGDECPGGSREGVREVCAESRTGPRLLRRLTRSELENTIRDLFPEVMSEWKGVLLTQDPVSSLGFSTDAKVLVVNGPTFKNLLDTSEVLADLVTAPGMLAGILPCSESAADAACAREFVSRYGLRIFRRPLTEAEVTRYVDYQQSVSGRSDFATGTKWALSVMLQSPHSFYRSEIGVEEGGEHKLSQYEIATNLAYTYSGSTPSSDLLSQAEAGTLTDPAARTAVAQALLEDQTHWENAREFFRQWLGYARVANQSRDEAPNFAEEISPALVEETRLFIDQILHGSGSVQDLLTADFTVLNGTLSAFYGYGDLAVDAAYAPVARPPERGLGLLGQGSLLAVTAHQAETSPTLRGLLFTESFLCVDPPKPPDIVPPLAEADGIENAKTTREKYELHHATGGCNNCHQFFDPFGFTFEQFDETGRYRADEDGQPLNTVAEVPLPDGTSRTIEGIEELSLMVNDTDLMENCISGLAAAYFLSGGGGANCLAEESRAKLARGEITLHEYLVSLAGTKHFASRGL